MSARTGRRGFSFIELLVVMSLLALIAAALVPVYGPSVGAMRARSARGDFTATLLFAQELAIREGREIRVMLDTEGQAWWLEGWESGRGDKKVFTPLEVDGERKFPEAATLTRVRARAAGGKGRYFIACYPNGACDRASLQWRAPGERASTWTLTTTGVLGGIEVAQ